MDEAEQAATWVDTLLSCCDPFVKSKRGRIITTAVTIALATFDVITDWYNWYSWTQFKLDEILTGYEIKILASTIKYERLFWFVAVASTVLFVMELIKAAIKVWQIKTNKTPVRKFKDPDNQPSYFSLFCSVVGALIGSSGGFTCGGGLLPSGGYTSMCSTCKELPEISCRDSSSHSLCSELLLETHSAAFQNHLRLVFTQGNRQENTGEIIEFTFICVVFLVLRFGGPDINASVSTKVLVVWFLWIHLGCHGNQIMQESH